MQTIASQIANMIFNLPCKCNHTQQVNLEMSHTIGIILKSHVPC